ncbi:hypothetical protein [Bradyrhizobium yuanmingense]|uniref:hypothetical protein n=1 Tax=Bradyrhizobium yuanmingense TaxID=108015 RepID=UPI0023B8EED4|nr:hypothetical protein [Bradyrhizobium yuanmingense]MDF0583429.1 hypothetical protein [Bradyrhizobium yuanmingense]
MKASAGLSDSSFFEILIDNSLPGAEHELAQSQPVLVALPDYRFRGDTGDHLRVLQAEIGPVEEGQAARWTPA